MAFVAMSFHCESLMGRRDVKKGWWRTRMFCITIVVYNACFYSSYSDSVSKTDSRLANVVACSHSQWLPGWKTSDNWEYPGRLLLLHLWETKAWGIYLNSFAISSPDTSACLRLTLLKLPSCAISHGHGYFPAICNSATRPKLLKLSFHVEAQKCIKLIILWNPPHPSLAVPFFGSGCQIIPQRRISLSRQLLVIHRVY